MTTLIDDQMRSIGRLTYRAWTTADVRYLRENFGRVPVSRMTDLLARHTRRGIRNMANRMGLRSALAPENIDAARAARKQRIEIK